ncbi:MAG TPA: terminase family protein [Allosphingosinicella sp.]|nr:terminase family protein [Allosphingosinicella sp.]
MRPPPPGRWRARPARIEAQFRALAHALARRDQAEAERLIAKMSPADLLLFDACFEAWAHEGQIEPGGAGWRTWLMMAGRGYGKTRAGAEWIVRLATQHGRPVRIALVAATMDEAREIMVEGESGLFRVGALAGIRALWEPSRGRLSWPGGSVAMIFSGENPDGLRGPQHHYAWCDELAKWARPEETWDNLQMGLRAGERPRTLVTTTPRPIPLLKRLIGEPRTVITRGRTDDNVTLDEDFCAAMAESYGGTLIGRQELGGELLEDVEGALWTRALIERCRVPMAALDGGRALRRVVVGVDPPAGSSGDSCGIVACGVDGDGVGYVLGDHSVRGLSPEGWAQAVVRAAAAWEADRVVAENNQGGDMVESVLRTVDPELPVRAVRARFGKGRRAEPVAIRFMRGQARFAGAFPELEDELCGLTAGGAYAGPGRSPDRADAMVWALTELICGRPRGEPGIRFL